MEGRYRDVESFWLRGIVPWRAIYGELPLAEETGRVGLAIEEGYALGRVPRAYTDEGGETQLTRGCGPDPGQSTPTQPGGSAGPSRGASSPWPSGRSTIVAPSVMCTPVRCRHMAEAIQGPGRGGGSPPSQHDAVVVGVPVPGGAGGGAAAGGRPGPAAGRADEVRRRQGRLQLHRVCHLIML